MWRRLLRTLSLSGSSGGNSLYGVIRFADDVAKQQALRHDVSVHIPQKVVDGRGIEYIKPIEHIALTAYPVIPGLGPWVIDETDPLGLTYHKELLPEGEWYKDADNLDFEVTASYLDYAPKTHEAMLENGVPVPYQFLHNADGTKLGDTLQLYKAPRSKQLPAKPAGAMSNKAKEHVLRLAQEKGNTMGWIDKLLQMLGITIKPEASEQEKLAAIQAKVEGGAQQGAAASQQSTQQQQQPPANGVLPGQQVTYVLTPQQLPAALQQLQQPLNPQATSNPPAQVAASQPAPTPATQQGSAAFTPVMFQPNQNGQVGAVQPQPGTIQLPAMPATQLTVKLSRDVSDTIRNAKKAQLDAAVATGAITPAEANILEFQYLNDAQLALSCSEGAPDPIGAYLKTRQVGQPAWQSVGRTPAGQETVNVALSHAQNNGQLSPLQANRAKRAEMEKAFK